MPNQPDIDLEGLCLDAAYTFARKCRDLKKDEVGDCDVLDVVINYLMTELWDNGFSQSEIKSAFDKAIQDMPRYAAGEERRGDRPSAEITRQ